MAELLQREYFGIARMGDDAPRRIVHNWINRERRPGRTCRGSEMVSMELRNQPLTPVWLNPGWARFGAPVALAAIQVFGSFFASQHQPNRAPLDALGFLLLLAVPALLTVRHRYPVPTLWAIVGVTLAYLLLDYPYGPVFLSVVGAL